jgi:predicted kinase
VAADVAAADAVDRLWTSNIDELLELDDVIGADQLEDVRATARRYIEGRRPLFARRIADGWARDGHGDLLADDIFALPDGPRILDCLAFDERLRCGDVLLDIAFLAMDLERLGAPAAAVNLFDWYSEFTHERHPRSLADFYVAYRALVRTKVNVLRAKQDRADAAEAAQRFFALCRRRLAAALPVVVMVGGSPGTGKSTIARALAERLGLVALSSDEVRKELVGLPHHAHAYAAPGEGIYTSELNERTYAELLRRSRHALSMGEPVVLDASWSRERDRHAVRAMADEVAVPIIEIRCELDAAVVRRRIENRMRTSTASDATPEVAAHIASVFESWPEATSIDTSGDLESTAGRALDVVRASRASNC